MHEGKEIEIRVDKKFSRKETQLKWIWNDDINCFTSLNKFIVTRYVNSMSNTLFKVLKINELIENLPGTENHNFNEF